MHYEIWTQCKSEATKTEILGFLRNKNVIFFTFQKHWFISVVFFFSAPVNFQRFNERLFCNSSADIPVDLQTACEIV